MKWFSLCLIVLAALCTPRTSPADAEKTPTIVVSDRTVVAFFPAIADTKSKQDPDANEALADFQLYAGQVRESFKKAGIEFHELYTRSFQVRVGRVVKVFRPVKAEVGYYFIAPGKQPRIEYGVMTDGDLLQVANEYFGTSAK